MTLSKTEHIEKLLSAGCPASTSNPLVARDTIGLQNQRFQVRFLAAPSLVVAKRRSFLAVVRNQGRLISDALRRLGTPLWKNERKKVRKVSAGRRAEL